MDAGDQLAGVGQLVRSDVVGLADRQGTLGEHLCVRQSVLGQGEAGQADERPGHARVITSERALDTDAGSDSGIRTIDSTPAVSPKGDAVAKRTRRARGLHSRPMALTATVRRFEISLSDADRGVYDELDLRVAQHPSENERYLVARVLARALEHAEGVDFSRGLAAGEEPALWQHDLRGDLKAWIEIGTPSTDRLHRASKTGARVVVYTWKAPGELAQEIVAARVHRAGDIELHGLASAFLDAVATTVDRNNRWSLAISGGSLYLDVAGSSFTGTVETVAVPGG